MLRLHACCRQMVSGLSDALVVLAPRRQLLVVLGLTALGLPLGCTACSWWIHYNVIITHMCCCCSACRAKLGPLLARVLAGIVADLEQLAGRLQSNERLLRREVEEYKKDPSDGASQGRCTIKVG